jgi:hypothetical protein
MTSLRPFAIATAIALLPSALWAQTAFLAELNGGQETPAVASAGTGTGRVLLDLNTSMIEIDLSVSGLGSPITAAHIHAAAIGVPGGVVIPLTGVGPTWSQSAGPLTPAQITALQSSNWYFNVHTTGFVNGEVRGQITPSLNRFDAYALGSKETPPNGSPGIGVGVFTLLPGGQLQYTANASGTIGTVDQAHLHEGLPGIPGGVIFPLTKTGPTTWSGMTGVLTAVQRAKLRAGFYYLNIHTTSFVNGELRGQVVPSFTQYGSPCPGTPGNPVADGSGAPVPNSPWTIDLTNGLPGGAGSLMLSGGAADIPVFGVCSFLLNPAPILFAAPVPLDGAGNFTLPVNLPPPMPIGWLAFQFAVIDGGAAGGVALSNGLAVSLNE